MADDLHTAIERAKEVLGLTELKSEQIEALSAIGQRKRLFLSLYLE